MHPQYIRWTTVVLLLIASLPAQAQTLPDAGRILQETRPAERAPAITIPPIQAPKQTSPSAPAVPPAGTDIQVNVTRFSFVGNQALSEAELDAVVAPWTGRALTFGDLIEAVEAVEALYKSKGYFLAQGTLPPQKIRDGAVEILMSEGLLASTRLEGESLVAPNILYAYLDKLPKHQALQLPLLERQVLLINELAGGQASLDLQAGEASGTTDIVLTLKPDEMLTGRVELNNHGAPSTGEKRLGLTFNGASPFHLGERISFNAITSEQSLLNSYNLRGELPLGGDGWKVHASASRAEYSLGGDFEALKASGTADSLRFGVSYPFLRSRAANLKLTVEADDSKLVDRFKASNTELQKHSQGLIATLSWDQTDELWGGGQSRADLALKTGKLHLGEDARAADVLGARGRFNKTNLTLTRTQTLSPDWNLQATLLHQQAGNNLDSSEKMSLGGPATLPGYANGEGSGDSGTHLKLNLRWQATSDLALTGFIDTARLTLTQDPLPAAGKNRKRLSDIGVTTDWQIDKNFQTSLIVAWAGEEKPNPADNDKPRMWLTLGYQW